MRNIPLKWLPHLPEASEINYVMIRDNLVESQFNWTVKSGCYLPVTNYGQPEMGI